MSTPYVAELLLQCQAMHLALAVVPGTNADTLLTIFSTLGQRQGVGKAQLIIDRLVFVQHMPRVMLVTQACEGVIVIGVVVVAVIVTGATFTAGIQGKAAAELLMNMAAIGLQIMTAMDRSEEHTSELQSREKLVCRLLLEKKTKLKAQKK